MTIDEEKQFVLTNFNKFNGKIVATDSDHYTSILEIDISYPTLKPTRVELYNLKDLEGQAKFKVLTSDTKRLTNCFESDDS